MLKFNPICASEGMHVKLNANMKQISGRMKIVRCFLDCVARAGTYGERFPPTKVKFYVQNIMENPLDLGTR